MKLISLQPSVSIILDRLGCLDTLAACTKYCLEAVPALRGRDLPVVHDSWSTKAEELLPVPADLVIASVPYRQESLAAILKRGAPVLALSPRTLADIESDIRLIAAIAHVREKGEVLIDEMRAAIEAVHSVTQTQPRCPLVFCEEWGKPLIHSQQWVAELVAIAGGAFLGAPSSATTAQAIASANPDVIVAAWCGAGMRVPLEKIVAQRQWQTLPAVRNGSVYCVADEILNTPAPTLIEGLHALARILHPDAFGEPLPSSVRRIQRISPPPV